MEQVGVIQPSRKVVFANHGDYWTVEGFALVFVDQKGKTFKIPVTISGSEWREIKDGAQIVALDYAPRVMIQNIGIPGNGKK